MSKDNSIKRENEADERKNAEHRIEENIENKPGLVTTLLRHQQSGFDLVGFLKKQKLPL